MGAMGCCTDPPEKEGNEKQDGPIYVYYPGEHVPIKTSSKVRSTLPAVKPLDEVRAKHQIVVSRVSFDDDFAKVLALAKRERSDSEKSVRSNRSNNSN